MERAEIPGLRRLGKAAFSGIPFKVPLTQRAASFVAADIYSAFRAVLHYVSSLVIVVVCGDFDGQSKFCESSVEVQHDFVVYKGTDFTDDHSVFE
jgi:hypothetical protein